MAKAAIAQMGRVLPDLEAMAAHHFEERRVAIRAARGGTVCRLALRYCAGYFQYGPAPQTVSSAGQQLRNASTETHAGVLPHAMDYNSPAVPAATRDIAKVPAARVLVARVLFDLVRNNGGPTSLRELGLRADALPRELDLALTRPYTNPRPLQRNAMQTPLRHAFDGSGTD